MVLGMALYRDQSIEDVVAKLDLALPGAGTIARSSVTQARERVGKEPVKWLFNRCSWSRAHESADAYRGADCESTELMAARFVCPIATRIGKDLAGTVRAEFRAAIQWSASPC